MSERGEKRRQEGEGGGKRQKREAEISSGKIVKIDDIFTSSFPHRTIRTIGLLQSFDLSAMRAVFQSPFSETLLFTQLLYWNAKTCPLRLNSTYQMIGDVNGGPDIVFTPRIMTLCDHLDISLFYHSIERRDRALALFHATFPASLH